MDCCSKLSCRRLALSGTDEDMPATETLRGMLEMICEGTRTDLGSMFSFTEMLSGDTLLSGESGRGLSFPIGYDTAGGSQERLQIDDRIPHYLIGGTTGSGKSKLLLGGVSSNNEAAAELEIPYAILNAAQGSVAGNKKFAVPEAKSAEIRQKLNQIYEETQSGGR